MKQFKISGVTTRPAAKGRKQFLARLWRDRVLHRSTSQIQRSARWIARINRATTMVVTVSVLIFATSANAADVKNGRKIYDAVGCYQCHGHAGQGGSAGPKLAPEPLPLGALRDFIRNTDKQMPPYPASILSDAEVADIHAYLASIPAAPKASTLPLLRDLK